MSSVLALTQDAQRRVEKSSRKCCNMTARHTGILNISGIDNELTLLVIVIIILIRADADALLLLAILYVML